MQSDILSDQSIIADKIIVYIDKDKHPDLVQEYKVKSLPDYFILRNNIELARTIGYQNKTKFMEWINNVK